MTGDALLIVKCLFTDIWSLFCSWHVPGTHMTPAEWAVFALTFILVLRFAWRLFDSDNVPTNSGGSDSHDIAVR